MDANEIRTALATHQLTKQIFKDVLAANQLPTKPNQRGIYVVNTHPKHMPGEHWITLEYTPTTIYYFDSYGLPTHPRVKQELHNTKALEGKTLLYHGTRLQGIRQTCGLYCIYQILTRSTNNHTLDIFNTDLETNDRIVYHIVHQMFRTNKNL